MRHLHYVEILRDQRADLGGQGLLRYRHSVVRGLQGREARARARLLRNSCGAREVKLETSKSEKHNEAETASYVGGKT
ncbi:hypothetical protein V493_01281 [Pseudogymnoascus sp. VKM F-4281 (FW-2241)]|nr:hypothetical protein V493_01281 [Pseudogymnoascus sp. VKM F-4281 (FW-2241)]